MTTRGAEEEIEQERTNNVELANDLNDLRLRVQEAEVQLKEWDNWFESGVFAPAEEKEEGEEGESEAATLLLQSLFCLPQLLSLLQCFTILPCHPDICPLLTDLFAFAESILRKR